MRIAQGTREALFPLSRRCQISSTALVIFALELCLLTFGDFLSAPSSGSKRFLAENQNRGSYFDISVGFNIKDLNQRMHKCKSKPFKISYELQ